MRRLYAAHGDRISVIDTAAMTLGPGADGKETGRVFLVAAQRTDAEPRISNAGGPGYT